MTDTMTDTKWKIYPFTVNGFDFHSRVNVHSDLGLEIIQIPVDTFISWNRDALKEFIKGRTTVIITHRLSTLELVDRILVMDEGRAIDCGTHEELMKRCDTYRLLRESEMLEAA